MRDELLDKIYWHWRKDDRGDGLQPMIDYRSALLAVVELHKPWGASESSLWLCSECRTNELESELYPCPTIRAIEKALQ